ncbi:MAG TPA: hypothetical protein VFQ95_03490 [Rhodanobacteraceae bacterium]|nr:hypothetical protein [Rhodanobacteraceae bacterium]
MRRLLANALFAGLGLALPLCALGQAIDVPVIQPVQKPAHARHDTVRTPVWQRDGNSVSISARAHAGTVAPGGTATVLDGSTRTAGAGVHLDTKPGITAHANLREMRWAPTLPACAVEPGSTCVDAPVDGLQRGEIGAGYAGHGVKLDLAIGQAQSESTVSPALIQRAALPRVLPIAGGADVAAPLWFRNSTATDISARGRVSVAPDTSVNLGASLGRVRFLPGSGLAGNDTVDQTTLSLGVQHGAVSGTIVGHVLDPNLPGAALDRDQRWSGVDLGVSVRLPWRGELNFGAQNVWSSGTSPLLFGPSGATPNQGRVPYVQYHQDL